MKIIIMLMECEVSKPSALINSRENMSCLSSYEIICLHHKSYFGKHY